ncbi:MAG: ATP-dependent DNA helicase [Firmicutes bacterium HGW-Firmicutes-1]|jgi:ATP-dependent DNA helicase DinG|nr:MAG: ATP-dependent DNA helicase [Firmicutes bacterium HGW-Firmicutes-1]
MSVTMKTLFDYDKKEEFPVKLAEWIGQVFYDILPEHGYEVREEQIFTAFQLADAVCKRNVHLAEAGPGTGKTFAYLLTAIAYARFSGKPVVIACATTALQEQLSGPKGDILTLAHILGLEIDARMAKDPRQYICDARVNESESLLFDKSNTMSNEIHQWLAKTNRGERSEMPLVPDRVWKQIGWDEYMSCDMCSSRGYCKLVKAREHYRPARDLIIADHGIFFDDLWTRDERIADGKLPILPSYAAVIFDEGHKVILPAAMHAGEQIIKEDIDTITVSIEHIQGARESLISITDALEQASSDFFSKLHQCVIPDESSNRLALKVDDTLLKVANTFHKALDHLLLEFQIEQELYIESLPAYLLQTYEAQIERATIALSRFYRNQSRDVIAWLDQQDGSFWVVPKNIGKMLDNYLFQKGLPVVFTSATLSNEGDFGYFTRALGLNKPSCSTVGSSFDMKNQVIVYLTENLSNTNNDDKFSLGMKKLISLLEKNEGRALVLTNSLEEVRKIRMGFKDYQLPFEVLWEDKGERGYLVRKFREEVSSVLIGANFWEGIDVPGEALNLLIVWQLPFPSQDPLIEQQRKVAKEEGLDPMKTVDYPEMGLKLKQGCGRLIRTKDDQGAIAIIEPVIGTPWEEVVMGALPPGAIIKN